MLRFSPRLSAALGAATLTGVALGAGPAAPSPATAAEANDVPSGQTLTQSSEVAPAAVEYVGAASRSANAATASVSIPAVTRAGDTLLLTAALSNTTQVAVPAGWRLVEQDNRSSSLRGAVWVKAATAADLGTTVRLKLDAIHKSAVALTVYRGLDDPSGVTAAARATARTKEHRGADVQVTGSGRAVSVWMDKGPSTTAWQIPSLQARTAAFSTGSGRVSVAVADSGAGSMGNVAGRSATTDALSTLGIAWTVVLPEINRAPRAAYTTSCLEGACTFDASQSSDPDGRVLSYRWNIDGVESEGVTATHARTSSGSFPVSLAVTDDRGATARASSTATVVVTPPVEPVRRSGTLYGMNVSPGSSFTDGVKETAADQVRRIVGTYGRLDVSKVFYSGMLPATFNASYEGQIPGKTVAVCFKPNQTQLANGSLDAAIKRYIDSVPAGWKVMLVNWQEPDDEMWKDNVFTPAQHRAATERLIDVARANPAYAAGRVEVWDVYMGYSLEVGRWQDQAVSPRLDGIGWDYYWNKPVTSWDTDPSVMLKRMAEVTKRIGVRQYGLWETGDNPHPNDPAGVGRAAFWNRVYTSATDLGYKHVIYFNAIGTTGDHRILPSTGFGDPTVAILSTWMNLS